MSLICRVGFLLVLLLPLVACDKRTEAPNGATEAPQQVLKVLAGSELKDMEPLLRTYANQSGVQVKLDYIGTLDAVDRLQEAHDYDAVWVSHNKYLLLVDAIKSQIAQSEKTMYSRVVLGVKPEVAQRLGWQSGKMSWKAVVQAAQTGQFRFAMTNPTGSNTGFVALVGLATELSGKGDALTVADIPSKELVALFRGQRLTAGSSGVLADKFLQNPQTVDGMVNYESVIKSMAAKGLALTVLVPKEGVITADYPLMLMKKSSKAPQYQALLKWLRDPATQTEIAKQTQRTPLTGGADDTVVNELPFPGNIAVVDALLKGFMDEYTRPITTYLVLDHSGSMRGDRIEDMRQAVIALAQGDGSSSGRFASLRARETLVLAPFSTTPDPVTAITLGSDVEQNKTILQKVVAQVNDIRADGGTAIYDTLSQVYELASIEQQREVSAVAIILLTDGENTNGRDFNEFAAQLQRSKIKVPIYPIVFGEANPNEMQQLAVLSGGQLQDARQTSLAKVFKKIRSNQ